jgi:HEAT repeat protein
MFSLTSIRFRFLVTCLSAALAAFVVAPASWAQDGGGDTRSKVKQIRELGKRDSQSIPALAQYLNDPASEVRIEAVKAIVSIGTQHSLTPLQRAASDADPEVQIRAVDGIVNFYVPGYVAKGLGSTFTRTSRFVKGFFTSRNDLEMDAGITVRDDAAKAIGGVIAKGASIDARSNAALAAGILRARETVPDLTAALRSRQTDLIYQSLIALEKIGDTSAGPSISLLAQDFDEKVQMTALEAIGSLRSVDSAPNVRQALERARNVKIRRAALAALALLGQPADRSLFLNYTADKDPQLRAAALEGLGRIRDPEDMPQIESAFNEQNIDERVRLAAAFSIVSEGKVETSEFSALRYLVNGLNLKAQANSAQNYLTELLLRPEIREAVKPLLPEATREEKMALAACLAQSGGADSVPVLESLANDTNPDVSNSARKSLRVLRSRLP